MTPRHKQALLIISRIFLTTANVLNRENRNDVPTGFAYVRCDVDQERRGAVFMYAGKLFS